MTNSPVKSVAEVVAAPDFMGCYLRHGRTMADGTFEVAVVKWKKHDRSEALPPDVRIPVDGDGLQALVDGLWRLGYRPSAHLDHTKATLAATEKHLADLRAILLRPTQDGAR